MFWINQGTKVKVVRVEFLSCVPHNLCASLIGVYYSSALVDKDHIGGLFCQGSELCLRLDQSLVSTSGFGYIVDYPLDYKRVTGVVAYTLKVLVDPSDLTVLVYDTILAIAGKTWAG